MYDICLICGCLYDTLAAANHYDWHATRGEYPPGEPAPEPDPETSEEAPDGNVGT